MARRTPGEGSVFQRSDGRWQASLQVDGKRRTVYGKTRQGAYRKLAELRRQARGGSLPNPGKRTLDDLLDHWLQVVAPTLKFRTLADYEQTSRLYLRPALGKTRLDRVAPSSIQHLYGHLQAQGLARAAAKAHAVLHRALRLAVLWGWLADNPCDRVLSPRYRPERREVWTPGELATFLEGAREHWLYPLWVCLVATGCRLGELQGLAWEDVDFSAGSIEVRRTLQRVGDRWVLSEPKTAAGTRTIALPAEAVRALRRQRAQQAGWQLQAGPEWANAWGLVFTQWTGAPLHGATVSHNLRRTCERLGIPHLTPHGLRHLHASLLLAGGLPVPAVSARLGHANPAITLRVYAHAIDGQDDAGAEAIGRALRSCGTARGAAR